MPWICVLCEYWPRRIVTRDGQQNELVTKKLAKVVPRSSSSAFVLGM